MKKKGIIYANPKMKQEMDIKQLKKELGLSQKDIAEFFNLSYYAFANSTAKKRYEEALCKFYQKIKELDKRTS